MPTAAARATGAGTWYAPRQFSCPLLFSLEMETLTNPELLELDPNGRIVIPVALRRALNLKAGDKLVAWVSEGRLIIRSRAEMVRELRAKFQRAPGEESLTQALRLRRRRARDG